MSAVLRELQVMRGFASCGRDLQAIDEAEAEYRELVDACRIALMWIEGDESTHGRTYNTGDELRAAIAKAEGRE